MKKKVVITHPILPAGIDLLKGRYEVIILNLNNKYILKPDSEHVRDCDALITLLSDTIDENLLAGLKKLKIIANYAVGYNNIDIEAARKHRVLVTNTPGVLTDATVEIAFALLLCLTRNILEADRFTRDGKFKGWDPLSFLGDELTGKNMGIIGMGRIGQAMALKCRAFGMNIYYHNRNRVDDSVEKTLNARYCSLDDLFACSDAISVHAPLTPRTHHLINQKSFEQMKQGVYFINTSRGEIVNEMELIKALQSGKVKGAGLDVYEFEPKITQEFLSMTNVVLLPHIGSATQEARSKMSEMVAKNVIAALEGKRPENLIPELTDIFDLK